MGDHAGGPALEPTLTEWLKARAETLKHLEGAAQPVDADWVQHLADLLATEQSWQAQYTDLVALGIPNHRFPSSNR